MAIFREQAGFRRWTARRATLRAAWCLLLFLLCLPGCGGCRKTPEAEELEKQRAEEKAKKKEKEPFEAGQPLVLPTSGSGGGAVGWCKPGHWVCHVWPDVKANRGDFQGALQTEIVDGNSRKVPLVAVLYELTDERPVALAKEQPKALESFTWFPPQEARSVNFKLAAGGGPAVIQRSWSPLRMPSYRYYFVVLTKAVGRYKYLDATLPSFRQPRPEQPDERYYDVVTMSGSRRPNLPTNALYWTSIAYLLWDDFDPAQCDVDQQRALVDWLHWGGQIIVSGPDALEQLRNSFLRPYLPATVRKSRTFSARDLEELSYWDWERGVGHAPQQVKPWPGAELAKDPDRHAAYLPYTGDLFVERQVGRGRIVASAFRLTGPELTGWKGFDCLFNACLLRRLPRAFREDPDSKEWQFTSWVHGKVNSPRLDAAQMTAVRYFSRDAGVGFESYAEKSLAQQSTPSATGYGGSPLVVDDATSVPANDNDPSLALDGNGSIAIGKEAPGLGAWNDFSPVAQAARLALADAAGIKVPERSFIIWVVVGYLCVLVPANWIVFRLLGRVEWAWFAAPLIAIACTIVVIQQAQLNIGFARSQNEIAVIEMQPGYSRAHVARYTKLYASLGTRYEFRLADPGGQILPFPGAKKVDLLWQTPRELICRRAEDTQLSGFSVASNAAESVHSEEMTDFGGTVTLHKDSDQRWWVTNGTTYPLDKCQVIRGRSSGLDVAHIDRLEPGASMLLKFDRETRQVSAAIGTSSEGPVAPTGELSVQAIADVARNHLDLRPEETYLLARVDGKVAGLTVTPSTLQTRQAALLVAHLDAGKLPDPEADTPAANSSPLGPNNE